MRKLRDPFSPTLTDLTNDRSKKGRAKSPTGVKTKQLYLQNLEKKLDELLTMTTNDKKLTTGNFNKPLVSDIGSPSKTHLNYENFKVLLS